MKNQGKDKKKFTPKNPKRDQTRQPKKKKEEKKQENLREMEIKLTSKEEAETDENEQWILIKKKTRIFKRKNKRDGILCV